MRRAAGTRSTIGLRRSLADSSGQAMAEYAIVVAALMGGLVGLGFTFLPDFINAIQRYYDNFYIILNLPIP